MSVCLDCGGSECVCRANRIIADLTAACQLFTQAFGQDGYIPMLGQPKTRRAVTLMRRAGVEPMYYGEVARSTPTAEQEK